jgi:hypothetical protein
MSSQFVDLNGDGQLDILAGSFSGAPQWLEGSEDGYLPAKPVMDSTGVEVRISAFWNKETAAWDDYKDAESSGHCTSSYAMDWDGDGDLDLLLGGYYKGHMFVRINTGSNEAPSYAKTNFEVQAGGEPLVVPSGLASPSVVDWDGDGKLDLLCGGSKGGVYFYRNVATGPGTEYTEAVELLPGGVQRSLPGGAYVNGPHRSFHIQPWDYDGDGDMDLLIGGISNWSEVHKQLEGKSDPALDFKSGGSVWLYRRK